MKEVSEVRTCDRCGSRLYKDAGWWIGSEMEIYDMKPGVITEGKKGVDLCAECSKAFWKWLEKS